jgi:voltage-gated potassium channel
VLGLVTALGGGAAFAAIEDEPETWDGVWWAVSTMTTVGYGDVYPETDSGRVLAIVLMLVGIGFVAVLTGAIAERFVAGQVRAEVQQRDANEEDVLSELREIMARLQRLETSVQSAARTRRGERAG